MNQQLLLVFGVVLCMAIVPSHGKETEEEYTDPSDIRKIVTSLVDSGKHITVAARQGNVLKINKGGVMESLAFETITFKVLEDDSKIIVKTKGVAEDHKSEEVENDESETEDLLSSLNDEDRIQSLVLVQKE